MSKLVYLLTVEGDKLNVFGDHKEIMDDLIKLQRKVGNNGSRMLIRHYEPGLAARAYHEFGKTVAWLWKELKEAESA